MPLPQGPGASLQETLMNRASSEAPPPPTSAQPSMLDMMGSEDQGDSSKISPDTAGYLGPEDGPFECEKCQFWVGPDSCKVVAGPIAPDGCCNNFTKGSGSTEPTGEGEDATRPTPSPVE